MNLQKKNGLEGRATYESTVQDHGLLAFSDSSILLYASVERSKLADHDHLSWLVVRSSAEKEKVLARVLVPLSFGVFRRLYFFRNKAKDDSDLLVISIYLV